MGKPVDISWESSKKTNRNPMGNQWKPNGDLIRKLIEIQWGNQWKPNGNRNPMGIEWENQWKPNRNPVGKPMETQWKSNGNPM